MPRNRNKMTRKTHRHQFKKQSLYKMRGCASKKLRQNTQKGGCGSCITQKGGSTSMSGPLVGSPWRENVWGWPGVDGISGNRNFLDYNNYHVDPQTQVMPHNFRNGYTGGRKLKNRKSKSRSRVGGWVYESTTSNSNDSSSNSSSTDKKKKKNKKNTEELNLNNAAKGTKNSKSRKHSKSRKNRKSRKHRKSNHKLSKLDKMGGGFIPQDLVNISSGLMFNVNSAYNALNGTAQPVNPLPFLGQINKN